MLSITLLELDRNCQTNKKNPNIIMAASAKLNINHIVPKNNKKSY